MSSSENYCSVNSSQVTLIGGFTAKFPEVNPVSNDAEWDWQAMLSPQGQSTDAWVTPAWSTLQAVLTVTHPGRSRKMGSSLYLNSIMFLQYVLADQANSSLTKKKRGSDQEFVQILFIHSHQNGLLGPAMPPHSQVQAVVPWGGRKLGSPSAGTPQSAQRAWWTWKSIEENPLIDSTITNEEAELQKGNISV